jgi:hypothetical protein
MKKMLMLFLLVAAFMTSSAFATKQVIVLNSSSNGAQTTIKVAMWFVITSGAQTQTAGSIWTGASAAENTAIQNGTVIEEVQTFQVPNGSTTVTIKDLLNKAWTARQAQINGVGPGIYSGIFFDSVSGWSA